MKFCILSCEIYPDANEDLRTLKLHLNSLGFSCQITPWQEYKFNSNDILLPLAVWDYSANLQKFLDFLKQIEHNKIKIINDTKIIIKNIYKTYLLELNKKSIPTIPTVIFDGVKFPWENSVIKPLVGQSGIGVSRISAGFDKEILSKKEFKNGAILQPFINEIKHNGEICAIFFDGVFSHAIHRKPSENDYRANSNFGVKIQKMEKINEKFLNIAEKAIQSLDSKPLYARIDMIPMNEDNALINEVEMIEPSLYFSFCKNATDKFCKALFTRLIKDER